MAWTNVLVYINLSTHMKEKKYIIKWMNKSINNNILEQSNHENEA
jgi:hypothetical protein